MSGESTNRHTVPCRVCGQTANWFFDKLIIGRHNVAYFKCPACGQVQTEPPHWLKEAYATEKFQIDVGMADRCVWTSQTTVALARRLGVGPAEPCLDWGAGTGLFVRLCRDYGLNYFYADPYATNVFARGFELAEAGTNPRWAFVTAFEVAEHFPSPLPDFDQLFQLSPRFILFSTSLYRGESPDWWYFVDNGQHVAFYTRRSLELIGERHGYKLASNGCDLHLFSRDRVSDRVLKFSRKSRDRIAHRYRKKHGSRIPADFEDIQRRLKAAEHDR